MKIFASFLIIIFIIILVFEIIIKSPDNNLFQWHPMFHHDAPLENWPTTGRKRLNALTEIACFSIQEVKWRGYLIGSVFGSGMSIIMINYIKKMDVWKFFTILTLMGFLGQILYHGYKNIRGSSISNANASRKLREQILYIDGIDGAFLKQEKNNLIENINKDGFENGSYENRSGNELDKFENNRKIKERFTEEENNKSDIIRFSSNESTNTNTSSCEVESK